MEVARVVDQARELWSRPVGRWLMLGTGLFVLIAIAASVLLTRTSYESLGTFAPADAVTVSRRLTEQKLPYRQSDTGYTFLVPSDRLSEARLLLAELELDPGSTIWAAETWTDRVSWSNTDFDKRRLWVEQTEANLVRSIRALSVVENARVQISVPTEKPLFREQEKPPTASVMLFPRTGKELTGPVVQAVSRYVANAVEGLSASDVVVVDAARSRVISTGAHEADSEREVSNSLLTLEHQIQEYWQQMLRLELERVVGVGNVAVIVNPQINWDRVRVEAEEYSGTDSSGKGVPLSEQTIRRSAEGTGSSSGMTPSGTTPNAEWSVPSYPAAGGSDSSGLSQDEYNSIINYLVNQTRTTTDRPGGAIQEITVGLLVNQEQIDSGQEEALKAVVGMAMGSKARVEVAAMSFAPSFWAERPPIVSTPVTGAPIWNYLLAALLGVGVVGLLLQILRPGGVRERRQRPDPVFAGPETAMMGGIPVSDGQWAAAQQNPAHHFPDVGPADSGAGYQGERVTPVVSGESEELDGGQFLELLGIDPEKVKMREKVERIARTNPEAVAGLLKTWISEG